MAATMAKADLDQVFAPTEDTEVDDTMSDEEDGEMDEAVNLAIDEVFETQDPELRREAFKRAVGLCSDSKY